MPKQITDEQLDVDLAEINRTSEGCMVANLGIEYTYAGTARVEGLMPVDERTCQPFGILHGGASLAFAETLAGLGTLAQIAPDERAVGQQVSGHHVSSAAKGDTVKGVATLMHRGRTSHVWNVDIFSVNEGKLVSTMRVLYCVLKKS
jgi:uncharacterized protein (TIGR00369 family)